MTDTLQDRPFADRVAAEIPYLRRYARALTGSQGRGDGYVALLLEALIDDASPLEAASDLRVGLYRAFQALWSAADLPAPGDDAVDSHEAAARERLGALTPRSRQALLLTAVEGFSEAQAAEIMQVPPEEIGVLARDAVAELRRQTEARVLIIEDEPIIAMDLESIVTDLGHSVVDIADTRATAVEAAQRHRPDLVLADIQLADDSSGVDAVREILETVSAPVIFITAFPDRLLTGARPEPTFLIAKPFQTDTVQIAISQALFFRQTAEIA
jgi:CheY-like chemotaxis protein/DNA-directed RNA polymerase specialized sigma24 family protein